MTTDNRQLKTRIIPLPTFVDSRGSMSVLEQFDRIPFDIKRIYWIYDVAKGEERGAHAHKNQYQLIVAVAGSFTVEVDTGDSKEEFHLDSPTQGLFVMPGTWRTVKEFTPGSVCLVASSDYYDISDYIREYNDFIDWKKSNQVS